MYTPRLIHLTVRTGEFRPRVQLPAVQNTSMDCLLETSVISHRVKATPPRLQKLMFYHSLSVNVPSQRFLTALKTSLTLQMEYQFRNMRTTQEVTIPPLSQAVLQAQCPTRGLFSVQHTSRLATKHLMLMANYNVDIFPNKPFTVLLSSVSLCSLCLSKKAVAGHALTALERSLTVNALKKHPP